MVQRRLVTPGVALIALVIASGFVGIIAWDADLSATDRNLASAERTTVEELPSECEWMARSIAASGTVSVQEYRVTAGPSDPVVVARHTDERGWRLGAAACTPRLTFENNLQVGDRSINVLGHTTKSTLHRQPAFGAAQLLFGVGGGVLVVIGTMRD